MDKEKAKFILQSFRPDGADAHKPEFAEALALAAEDRELGEWLAQERATDATFAAMLAEVAIPEDLRESILAVLADGVQETEFSDIDAAFVGALASVRPPEGLREQILSAMQIESEATVVQMPKAAPRRVSRWLASATVAAAVVLGAFVALQVSPGVSGKISIADNASDSGLLSLVSVERGATDLLDSWSFTLDKKESEHPALMQWLSVNDLPAPKNLPPSLASVPGIGCKELKFNGKTASLLCFKQKAGVVHLIVLNREDVEGDLPTLADVESKSCQKSGWSRASWADGNQAFMLLGKMDSSELSKTF